MQEAEKLLEFAAALARGRPQRVPLLVDLARSLGETGKLRRAEEFFGEVAGQSDVARFEAASLGDYTTATADSFKHLVDVTPDQAARSKLGKAEHARAAVLAAEVSWTTGEYSAMKALLREARTASRGLGRQEKQPLLNSILGWEARALLLGPERVAPAIRACDRIAGATGSSVVKAVALAVKAGLTAMRGQFEEARLHYEKSRRIGVAYGLDSSLAALALYSGPVELLDGSPGHAESQLRQGYDALDGMGDRSRQATTAAFLAHALYEQGKNDDAKKFALKSKELGAEADKFTEVMWRGALAKALARGGDCKFALELAQEAVNIAPAPRDAPNLRGDALLDHAEVLRLCKPADARAKAQEARGLYKNKGNVAAVRRVDAFIARLP